MPRSVVWCPGGEGSEGYHQEYLCVSMLQARHRITYVDLFQSLMSLPNLDAALSDGLHLARYECRQGLALFQQYLSELAMLFFTTSFHRNSMLDSAQT